MPIEISIEEITSDKINHLVFKNISIYKEDHLLAKLQDLDILLSQELNMKLSSLNIYEDAAENTNDLSVKDFDINYDMIDEYSFIIKLVNIKADKIQLLDNKGNIDQAGNLTFTSNPEEKNSKIFSSIFSSPKSNFSIAQTTKLNFDDVGNISFTPDIALAFDKTKLKIDCEGLLSPKQKKVNIENLNIYFFNTRILNATINKEVGNVAVNLNLYKLELHSLIPDQYNKYLKKIIIEGQLKINSNIGQENSAGKFYINTPNKNYLLNISSLENKLLINLAQNNLPLIKSELTFNQPTKLDFQIDNNIINQFLNIDYIKIGNGSTTGEIEFDINKSIQAKGKITSKIDQFIMRENNLSYKNIAGEIDFNQDFINIKQFILYGQKTGYIKIHGKTQLNSQPKHNYQISINNLTLEYRDRLKTKLLGDLLLQGTGPKINLRGDLYAIDAVFKIPDLKNFNNIPKLTIEKSESTNNTETLDLSLNLKFHIKDKLLVKGKGMSASLTGIILANGPMDSINIDSDITIKDGKYSLFNKEFTIKKSQILTAGNEIFLHLNAEYKDNQFLYLLEVTGTIEDQLKIKLSSKPYLPEDEIIARLVFNKDIHNLSAMEIVSLGSYIMSLNGNNTTDKMNLQNITNKLGIDSFEFTTTDKNTYKYMIKKKVGNKFTIGIENDTSPEDNKRFIVEKEFSDRFFIYLKTTEDSFSNLGIKYRLDY